MNMQILVLSLAILTLSGCGNNNPFFQPEVNPKPKYFMIVEGHIDPELAKIMMLKFLREYQTTNPSCTFTVNMIEGVYRPYNRISTINAKPDARGNYSIKIPLDYYLPGKCQWQAEMMQYLIAGVGSNYSPIDIAVFVKPDKLPSGLQTSIFSKILCDNSLQCSWRNTQQYSEFLPVNHNYLYRLDFVSK